MWRKRTKIRKLFFKQKKVQKTGNFHFEIIQVHRKKEK